MTLWSKEPAAIIGIVASVILLVGAQLLASGIVASDGSVKLVNFVMAITPLIASLLTRSQVSSPATVAKLTGG